MAEKKKKRPWRYYNILLHRYLGYFFLGITLVYAISGFAVNHMESWNPNYIMQRREVSVQALPNPDELSEKDVQGLLDALGIEKSFNMNNVFYPDPQHVELLISSNETLMLDTQAWTVEHELLKRRPGLHLFNFLHLNNAKKAWTFYADAYAIALFFLALSGLFMKKGKKGALGEAGLWTLAGMVLPVALILMYYR